MQELNEREMKDFAESLKRLGEKTEPEKVLRRCEALGVRILTLSDPAYPPMLAEIYDPPRALYLLGEGELSGPMTAVVGSRAASEYGRQAALAIGEILARGGVTVVSGMARGIDSFAHRGAVTGGGQTVAVLGCGVDLCYPPENAELREDIRRNGLLVSEYPPGTKALAFHFPRRNRIISGLCRETVVVEAGEKSGSLITAEQALEQGRDVYCVGGSIFCANNSGAHRLLREGAGFLGSLSDVKALCYLDPGTEDAAPQVPEELSWLPPLLSDFGTGPDELARKSGKSPAEVLAAAVRLETAGAVRRGRDGLIYPLHTLK